MTSLPGVARLLPFLLSFATRFSITKRRRSNAPVSICAVISAVSNKFVSSADASAIASSLTRSDPSAKSILTLSRSTVAPFIDTSADCAPVVNAPSVSLECDDQIHQPMPTTSTTPPMRIGRPFLPPSASSAHVTLLPLPPPRNSHVSSFTYHFFAYCWYAVEPASIEAMRLRYACSDENNPMPDAMPNTSPTTSPPVVA